MVYIYGTLATLFLAYIAMHIDKSKMISKYMGFLLKRIFMILSVIPLATISAVRYGVGTDYFSYKRIYGGIYLKDTVVESGFRWLVTYLHNISDNPQVFFGAMSFVFCSVYFYSVYKNSLNPVYSIFLFVVNGDYFFSMNGIRQAIATAIVLLALPYFKTRNWKRVLIIIFFASLFHTSAWFFVLLYILTTTEWKQIVYFSTILCTFVMANFIKFLIFPFLQRFTTYGRFFLKTSIYAESNIDWTRFMIYMSFFVFMSYKYRVIRKNMNSNIMYTAIWIALIIVASGVAMPKNVTRLTQYMNPIISIYTPEMTKCITNKQLRFLMNYAIVFCYTAVCINSLNNGWHNALPYQTFWSQ